jgi:uncharacterized membrane protein required for colicin V production
MIMRIIGMIAGAVAGFLFSIIVKLFLGPVSIAELISFVNLVALVFGAAVGFIFPKQALRFLEGIIPFDR